MEKSKDRLLILQKIEEYEKEGKFDVDVEDDPITKVLLPRKVDYLNKKLSSKIATRYYNMLAEKFFEKLIKQKQLIIDKVIGLDNIKNVTGGAFITCNHFNAFDSYALYKAIKSAIQPKMLYKVIREGNYTSFPGFFGKVFKHCNTLPLSSNTDTMKLFLHAVTTLLHRNEKILIYPEQAMWWNYKKPRPLKSGAYNMAVKNNVPVIPCFITMEDSDVVGRDGFYIQKYTIHIAPAIYPDTKLNAKQNIEMIKNKNFEIWKNIYETTYGVPLSYSTISNQNTK